MSRFLLVLLLASASFAQTRDAELYKLADRVFDDLVFRYDPASGTQAGFHQYDSLMPTMSHAEFDAQAALIRKFIAEAEGFDPNGLSPFAAADRELVLAQIRGQLLALESIRMWEKNPDIYSSGATNAIFVIMSRTFAPPADRLKSSIAREKLIPRLFQSARENLKNPPRDLYRSRARATARASISFFQNDVPAAFKAGQQTPRCWPNSRSPTRRVIDALKAYRNVSEERSAAALERRFPHRRRELSQEAALRRDGGYAARPAARRSAMTNLRRNQAEFKRVAAQIDPKRTARADSAGAGEGPSRRRQAAAVVPRCARAACAISSRRNHIVTIPSPVPPIVEETPPFMRALTSASMDTPGPLRKGRQGSVLQRHAAGARLAAKADRRVSGGLQPRHHHQHRGARGVSRPLHAVPLDAARAQQGAQADGLQFQRRRLGALQRADDARRRLRQGRSEAAAGTVAGRAAAQRALHRRHPDAHRQDDLGAGGRVLREGRLPGAADGGEGGQARHLRPHVSGIHARQAGDPEVTRGLQEDEGRRNTRCRNFTMPSCSRAFPPIKIVRKALLGNDSPVL